MSPIDAIASFLARRLKVRPFRIVPRAVRKKGGRARRQAFQQRAKTARLVERIALAGFSAQEAELQQRFRNVILYGTSHPEALRP